MAERPESVEIEGQGTEILEKLRKSRTALLLTLPSSDHIYTSRLLEVSKAQLQIDQLVPRLGDQLLGPGMSLGLRSSLEGINYRFTAQHLGSAADERGFPYHTISRPERIESQDKRLSYRIHVRQADSPDCRISLPPDQASQSLLEDISEGGARLRVQTDRAPLHIGKAVDFSLEFESYGELCCQGRVCYLQPVPRSKQSRVGIAFKGLSTAEIKSLRRILMGLQRHNIKTGVMG